ncbi:MAG: hypothetical protein J0I47_04355 [Sphingomonas sp.]|uniref:hypothetical protein n=1 Tax=Sphingomonas sp. TaxID=28214 RepID=UPI001AC968EB|nr:hypothetical protein [Sphingomonas sp.]MBN8807456.1 hypothetical protein [Sphingomonas sp.]
MGKIRRARCLPVLAAFAASTGSDGAVVEPNGGRSYAVRGGDGHDSCQDDGDAHVKVQAGDFLLIAAHAVPAGQNLTSRTNDLSVMMAAHAVSAAEQPALRASCERDYT